MKPVSDVKKRIAGGGEGEGEDEVVIRRTSFFARGQRGELDSVGPMWSLDDTRVSIKNFMNACLILAWLALSSAFPRL